MTISTAPALVPLADLVTRLRSDLVMAADRPDADFEAFFNAHYAPLVRSMTLIAGGPEAAADAVQDAFIKAYAHWRKIRHFDAPIAWVRRVAINKCIDAHRTEARRRRRQSNDSADHNEDKAIEDKVIDGLFVRALVDRLNDRQRTIAALFYLEELPVATIAYELALSEGAVKFHLHKARECLRTMIEHEDAGR